MNANGSKLSLHSFIMRNELQRLSAVYLSGINSTKSPLIVSPLALFNLLVRILVNCL